MIKMKLVAKTKVYMSYPNLGIIKQGEEVKVYKKFQKDMEDMGFELVEEKKDDKDKGVKE